MPEEAVAGGGSLSSRNRSERRYRLLSSRGVAGQGSTEPSQKYIDIAAGRRLELCHIRGRGRIVRFWMTLPVLGRGAVLKDAVLRIYWDGEASPSIEVPVGDFFGASFGKPVHLVSERSLIVGGAYLSRFEMPFNESAIIELSNDDSGRILRALFFQIGYYEEPTRELEPTLHAQFRRQRRTREREPFVALHARGHGWFAGLRMDIQSQAWWLKPPFKDIALPRGFGLGLLEGWEEIVVDGDLANPIAGTGAEDYFSGGFYFKGAPFCTPTHGCTNRSFFTGRVSAYRFHIDDPIYFSDSIQVTMDHGLRNTMVGDYSSVAYWYQYEPHDSFPALPSTKDRHAAFPWMNPLQWLLAAVTFLALATVVAYALFQLARGGR